VNLGPPRNGGDLNFQTKKKMIETIFLRVQEFCVKKISEERRVKTVIARIFGKKKSVVSKNIF
jgi:hypothetical protein